MIARRLVHQVLALVRGRRLDRELNDEIAAHLEMAEAEGLAAGLSPEQAKRRARLRFGGVDGMVEEHRDRRSVRWLENAVADVRFGTRMAVREPGFTAVIVGVLALGIGATAAMFSLFDAALIKALPFPNADRIVRVWEAPREGVVNATSAPDFLDWRRLGTSFEALAAEIDLMGAIRGDGDPIRLPGKAVTADYFRVFGIGAERGRTFVAGDDRAGGANVIVLNHATWETMFGTDPNILKRSLVIDGEPYRIIGILPAGVFDRGEARFWKPLAFKHRTSSMELNRNRLKA